MNERLRARDVALLAAETATSPRHNCTLEIFDATGQGADPGLSYDRLVELIADRIDFVPRYRQRVLPVPGRLAGPVWADDPTFDLSYHVRRSALPRPGTLDQLRDLTARIVARRLDRERPLWEVYLIEGLHDGRVAVLTKSHQILVDGVSTVDLGQVLLDVEARRQAPERVGWQPRPRPSAARLVLDAVADNIERPHRAVANARGNVVALARGAGALIERVSPLPLPHRGLPLADSPFNEPVGGQRRVVLVRTVLKDYRKVRRAHGGTVNDVILATIAGALRQWLMARSQSVGANRRLRALVPMSVIDEELEPTSLGQSIVGTVISLPVGETSPVVRLHQVSYALRAHKETGRAVGADRIAGVAGFAPTTFHALGARIAEVEAPGAVNLVITNVPGPQFPMYLGGAPMTASYPLPALQPGCSLAIGVTSYDGAVYYGLTADRDALPDADLLGQCLTGALEELVDSASPDRPRAARGRRPSRRQAASKQTVRKKADQKADQKPVRTAARRTSR